jgi:hypothetical protein
MINTWHPYNRRPRSRLRKRKNSPYYPRLYSFNKYNSHIANKSGCDDKDRILESGFTVGESWGCLDKAWVGFRAAKRLENYADMKLYASVIQRLQRELKIEVNEFQTLNFVYVTPLKKEIEKKTITKMMTQNWLSLIFGLMKRFKKQKKTII